ncbi:hypothetical protein [Micromonospora taraxaci]
MQMTIQGADDEAIDKLVADVRTYCVDSGQTAFAAFGDARAYATKVGGEPSRVSSWSSTASRRITALLSLVLGLAVLQIAFWGSDGGEVPVSLGHTLIVALAAPAWVVLTAPWLRRQPRDPRMPERPAFDEAGWRPILFALGLGVLSAVLWIAFDQTLFIAPNWALISSGLTLVLAGIVLARLARPRRAPRTS